MKVEFNETTTAVPFEELEYGTIFSFSGTPLMKIYDCFEGVDCGLSVDPASTDFMETVPISSKASITTIYTNSILIIK